MTTAFVTGPTGCIGAATVEYLLDHGVDRVVGMSRKRDFSRIAGQYHDRLEFMEGDITSLEQVQSAICLLYTSPSPRDKRQSRMPSSA